MEYVRNFVKLLGDMKLIEAIINRCPADMDTYVDAPNPINPEIHGFYTSVQAYKTRTHDELKDWPCYDKPRYSVQMLLNAVNGNPFKVDQKVKFDDEKRFTWTVRAVREEFAILTSVRFGRGYYTIADTIECIRGADNCYGVGYDSQEAVDEAMLGLFDENPYGINIEISYRNRVPLVIAGVKTSGIEVVIGKYGVDGLKEIINGVTNEAKYFVDAFSEGLQKQGFCTDKRASSVYGAHNFYPLNQVRKAIGLDEVENA